MAGHENCSSCPLNAHGCVFEPLAVTPGTTLVLASYPTLKDASRNAVFTEFQTQFVRSAATGSTVFASMVPAGVPDNDLAMFLGRKSKSTPLNPLRACEDRWRPALEAAGAVVVMGSQAKMAVGIAGKFADLEGFLLTDADLLPSGSPPMVVTQSLLNLRSMPDYYRPLVQAAIKRASNVGTPFVYPRISGPATLAEVAEALVMARTEGVLDADIETVATQEHDGQPVYDTLFDHLNEIGVGVENWSLNIPLDGLSKADIGHLISGDVDKATTEAGFYSDLHELSGILQALNTAFADPKLTIRGHNWISYDMPCLEAHGFAKCVNVRDTMMVARLARPDYPKGLLAQRLAGYSITRSTWLPPGASTRCSRASSVNALTALWCPSTTRRRP